MSLTVTTRSVFGVSKPIHIFVGKEKKIKAIMLKTLGATVQNLVARATRRPGFSYPCYGVQCLMVMLRRVASQIRKGVSKA